jgi:hypothetical protein
MFRPFEDGGEDAPANGLGLGIAWVPSASDVQRRDPTGSGEGVDGSQDREKIRPAVRLVAGVEPFDGVQSIEIEVDQKWALGEVGGGQVCDREAPQRGRGNVVRFGKIEIPGVDQHDAVFHRGPEAQPSSHPRRG